MVRTPWRAGVSLCFGGRFPLVCTPALPPTLFTLLRSWCSCQAGIHTSSKCSVKQIEANKELRPEAISSLPQILESRQTQRRDESLLLTQRETETSKSGFLQTVTWQSSQKKITWTWEVTESLFPAVLGEISQLPERKMAHCTKS